MAFDLRNRANDTIRVSGGAWAVFLTLAETFGWKPAGTEKPPDWPDSEIWSGQYDTMEGQVVTDADAIRLAQVLHGAALHPKLEMALSDVIRHLEDWAKAQGLNIPDGLEMHPADFYDAFSPLLLFLYQGGFTIE